ncbi:MAG TPA: putative Ig domain-containing protein [Gammaproteobacteria bacterium]
MKSISVRRRLAVLCLFLAGCGGGGGGSPPPSATAPTGLTYTSPQTYTVGTAIAPLQPTVTGTVTSFSVAPVLPAGLVLNSSSGVIAGTPSAVAAQADYTIAASNSAGSTTFALRLTVQPTPTAPPTALSYPSPQTYAVGTAIAPLDPSVTGSVTSYTVVPPLPAGLALDAATGRITGTPSAVTAQGAYTITASNSQGGTGFVLTLTVVPPPTTPPSALTYQSPVTFTVGSAITALSPSVTGVVTSYSVTPALPAGLVLNANGQITGTPTAASGQATYTVRASNAAGSTTFDLAITIVAAPLPPPSALSYPSPQSYTVGVAIAPLNPSVTGSVTTFTVSPALPPGLALNANDGRIAGTPTAARAQAGYVVTAGNASGSTSFTLTITVAAAQSPPSALSYPSPQALTIGTPITPLSPTVSGTPTAYSVAPALPPGLVLDTTTGVISGTPTAQSAQTVYTITASNAAGDTTFGLSISVSGGAAIYTVGGTVSGLTTAGLMLTNNSGDVLSVGSNGSFIFATALSNGADYSVEVAAQPSTTRLCKVSNATGTIAGANVTNVTVVCAPPQWGTAAILAPPTGFAGNPEIDVRPDGSAALTWWHYDGTVHLQRYGVTSGWNAAEPYASGAKNTYHRLAFDSAGNGIAVWRNTANALRTRRFAVGAGWGAEEAFSPSGSLIGIPHIHMDDGGNAVAVWIDGAQAGVYARRYLSAGGWQPVEKISSATGTSADLDTAMDGDGNISVVWNQDDGANWNAYANRYESGAGWGNAVTLETTAEWVVAPPRVAAGPNGTAFVVWPQWTPGNTAVAIFASRYTSSGWDTPVVISGSTTLGNEPFIAVDSDGNAVAIWIDNAILKVHANRYTAASGWGTATSIQSSTGNAEYPDLAIDANGVAMAVWEEVTPDLSAAHIWANRFVPGSGWDSSTQISTGTGVAARAPRIGVDSQGRAIAVWHQWPDWAPTSSARIWTNRFD